MKPSFKEFNNTWIACIKSIDDYNFNEVKRVYEEVYNTPPP